MVLRVPRDAVAAAPLHRGDPRAATVRTRRRATGATDRGRARTRPNAPLLARRTTPVAAGWEVASAVSSKAARPSREVCRSSLSIAELRERGFQDFVETPGCGLVELERLAHLSGVLTLSRATRAQLEKPLSMRFEVDVLALGRSGVDTEPCSRNTSESSYDCHLRLLTLSVGRDPSTERVGSPPNWFSGATQALVRLSRDDGRRDRSIVH